MGSKEWQRLIEEGRRLAEEGNFKKAEQVLKDALELKEDVIARNNLAMAVFLSGEAARALELLKPNLNNSISSGGNPFSFALAAQICAALEREKEARSYLKSAVTLFEKGRALLEKLGIDEQPWNEYTIAIMRGAAALNDHRQVFDLYCRWERYHVSWENRYMAGVAAFNMGRYGRAASLWGSLSGTGQFAVYMQQVAFLVERGLVPPFPLEYSPLDPAALKRLSSEMPEALSSSIHSGAARAAALSYLFSPEIDEKSVGEVLSALIKYGDDWGEAFGKRLLEAAAVPREFKINAALALVECGVFKVDEPIPVFIDGYEEMIKITTKMVTLESDPELERLNWQARELRDRGCLEDAVELLEPLLEQGRFHPAAMVTLANLYRSLERFEEARTILELLDEILPESPAVLFNLAGLWIECGVPRRALNYLDQLEEIELDEELTARVEELRMMIEMNAIFPKLEDPGILEEILLSYEEQAREAVEKKVLPLEASLLRGLKNMPNEWLLNICAIYGLEPCRRRPDREKMITGVLNREEVLHKAVAELDETERELLGYLLKRGGWARLNVVTRKFGTMQEDGYHWLEDEPLSPLGQLWSRALVMVGRARLTSGYARVAAIPVDLRKKLATILGVAPGGEA
ncbi:MAG: tetratricopeptide repeat protein [Dethiobacteria bacterium]